MIEASKINSITGQTDFRSKHLAAAVALMTIAGLATLFWLLYDENGWRLGIQLKLLPWIGATAVVLLAPAAYQFYKGKFDLFHPLIYASWTYWFPSFVIGGLLIAADFISPYQLNLLADPESDLIWTYIYLMIGFASMTFGFYLPYGRLLGEYASRKLPVWDWTPRQTLLPAALFLGIGLYFFIVPFISSLVGLSLSEAARDPLSTLNVTLSFLTLEAGFLAAMCVFKTRGSKFERLLAFGMLGFLLISKTGLSSSRSTFISIVILMAMAYLYSGRKITATVSAIFGVLVVLSLIIGMIYGTTFRYVKVTEDQLSLDQQLEIVGQTIDTISAQDSDKVLKESLNNLGERIDGISTVAVVVGNYERLNQYEAGYGIKDNIYTDLWTSFIPRYFWENKPLIFDSRSYSDLYFNFSGNSYALTPTADLLRNFGPYGIPIGMLLVGLFLRVIYAMLIENQKITIGRATVYYLFLVSISYEGFYATIFVYGVRIVLLAIITLACANFLLIARKKT